MKMAENHPLRSFLEEVFQAGNRAKRLVDGILRFARGAPEDKIPVSLSVLIKENVKFLQQLIPSNIEFVSKIEVTPGEDDTVLASPTEFQQILMNLVVNAVQAIEDRGRITISLRKCFTEDGFPNGLEVGKSSYMKLCVSDTGCGIDPSIIHRIFDPCFTTKPPGQGTGMGLTIVYNAVKNMGGMIQVESRPKKGTTFKILIPVLDKKAVETQKEWVGEDSKDVSKAYRQLMRVLVVDDDEALLKMLKIELEMEGFHVTTFSCPYEALKSFAESPFSFDVAIVDYRMPKMTGLELVRRFFSIRPDFPMVVMTGYLEEKMKKEAELLGVRFVIVKPVSLSDMVSILQACGEIGKAHEESVQERL
ncbi:MAG: ATP-binding protein [Thermodesulforhabdaceae bacterium]